ncbi:MAG: hypothetical protein HC806_09255 [Anaerolineae bacterium]|nr:hypothetical protein [Anaerolineae bacterium]
MAEVERLAKGGRKIDAIKLVREQTRWGLKESKDFVDALAAGSPLPTFPPRREYPSPSSKITGSPDWSSIRQHLEANNKIQAIKIYREQTGSTLKDAKEAVEMFERGRIHPRHTSPLPPIPVGQTSMKSANWLPKVTRSKPSNAIDNKPGRA